MAKVRRPINSSPVSGSSGKVLITAVIIAVAGAAFYFGRGDAGSTSGDTDGASAYALPTPAHGPADAPVILAKWTDFQ